MIKQPVNQVRLTNVAIVRLRKQGKRFEVACYRNKMLNWRSGTESDLSEVLQTESIFQNVSKGQLAKIQDIEKCFGTRNLQAVAKIILEKGELQVSQQERETTMAAMFKDVCTLVAERVFNRRTGLPLTVSMVQQALTSLGFSVSIDLPVKRQSLKAIDLLLTKLPEEIARSQMLIRVTALMCQRDQIRTFLTDHCHAMIRDEHLGQDDTEQYTMTLLCLPPFYREIDRFVLAVLSPPGAHQVVSVSENVLNPNDTPAFTERHRTTDTLQSEVSVPTTQELVPQEAPVFSAPKAPNGSVMTCRSCDCAVSSGQEYRLHCTTEWHKFNVKRKFKQLPPITQQEYDELAMDIKEGFLAVDS